MDGSLSWPFHCTQHGTLRCRKREPSTPSVAFTGPLFGAVCPARGAAVGLVLPFVSTEAMNAHLAEISRNVAAFVGKTIPRMVLFPSSPHAVLILDGAGWHGANALVVPDNLSLLTLPP